MTNILFRINETIFHIFSSTVTQHYEIFEKIIPDNTKKKKTDRFSQIGGEDFEEFMHRDMEFQNNKMIGNLIFNRW